MSLQTNENLILSGSTRSEGVLNICHLRFLLDQESIIDEYSLINKDMAFYPNPTKQWFIIETELWDKPNVELRIFDINGKHKKTKKITSYATTVNTSDWSKGVYNCVLLINGQISSSKKIVVK